MAEKLLAEKLKIKEGHSVLLVNVAKGYQEVIQPLPAGVTLLTTTQLADIVLLFITSRQEMERQ